MTSEAQINFPSLLRIMDVFRTRDKSELALRIMSEGMLVALEASSDAADYRKQCLTSDWSINRVKTRMTALNQVGGLNGIGQLNRTYRGRVLPDCEKATYLKVSDNDKPTVIHWRNRFRVKSLNQFIITLKASGINFDTGAL